MAVETLRKHKIDAGLIVDLGSGTGIVAQYLLENGYDALGIEYSDAFMAVAQKKKLQAQFIRGLLFDVEIPSCAAAILTSECFNYVPDTQGPEGKENGIFIFDILEPRPELPRDKKKVIEGSDWTIFSHTLEDKDTQQLTSNMILFRQVGELYRKTTEQHNH